MNSGTKWSPTMRRLSLVYVGVALVTVAVFWPLVHCGFINLDDTIYVTTNAAVLRGLTETSIRWAFVNVAWGSNWHPLTWLSHMLDVQVFGLNPGAYHLVNVFFHAANTLLLFHVLRRMTRDLWPSAIVAALFSLHPLHVESVAWISERKDVLSTFFGLLTLWAYSNYTGCTGRKGIDGGAGAGQQDSTFRIQRSTLCCLLALVFFSLGLMSKPMLVTWPFVMLLLDFWPLGRVSGMGLRLSSSMSDSVSPRPPGLQTPVSPLPVARCHSGKLVLEKLPYLVLSAASCVITVIAQRAGGAVADLSGIGVPERIDNALVAYAGYLLHAFWPQGLAAYYPLRADRPEWHVAGSALLLVGVSVMVLTRWRRRPWLAVGWLWFLGTLVPVIGLVQVGVQASADRYMYIPSIGLFIIVVWGLKELAEWWRMARLGVGFVVATALTGCAILSSIQLRYWKNGETLFRHAVQVTRKNPGAEYLLGDALMQRGKLDESLVHLEESVRLDPAHAPAQVKLANVLSRLGRFAEAIEHYRIAASYQPNAFTLLNNLAWILASNPDPALRNGPEAVRMAERACNLTNHRATACLGTLAAAYAETGRFDEAIQTAKQARALAISRGQKDLARKNEELLQEFRMGRPYRDTTNSLSSPLREGL